MTMLKTESSRGVLSAGAAIAVAFGLMGSSPVQAQTKTPPYWASIAASEARMRVGPSLDYPSSWVYRRKDLPVRVVQVHSNWRKIEDPSGTQGWMHVRLLSDTATAMVKGAAAMRDRRSDDSPELYSVEAGVVGRVSDCSGGWCLFDVAGQRGFIHASALWGATE